MHLDMVRGLAAITVVIQHVRAFVLVDFGEVASPNILIVALYFLTSLGHQAVIVFFALSGYLVGGKAFLSMLSGRWSATEYAIARLSRLWTLIVPALTLTLVLDLAGAALGGANGYAGGLYPLLSSGPRWDLPADHSVSTFVYNLLFLQTIVAPVYGSNGPLWSLANEFWYYVAFPLLGSALLVWRHPLIRIGTGLSAVILTILLPSNLMILGSIWVGGALAHAAGEHPSLRSLFSKRAYLILTMLAAISISVFASRKAGLAYDILTGCTWCLLLPALAVIRNPPGVYSGAAVAMSEVSFTVYAVHFPIIAFIYFTVIAPKQFQPDLVGILLMVGLVAVSAGMSIIMWWCFERNSRSIRTFVINVTHRARSYAGELNL